MSPRTTSTETANSEQQIVNPKIAHCRLFFHHPVAIDFQLRTDIHKEQTSPKQDVYNNKFRECR